MSSAACLHNALDRCFTTPAEHSSAHVHEVFELEKTTDSLGIDVVGDGGSAQADGMFQDVFERKSQALQFSVGETSGTAARPDAGAKEALIGVDVAYTREQLLIEERSFDGELPAAEKRGEFFRADGKRLGSCRGEGRSSTQLSKLEAAKPPRINKAQFASAGKRQPRVGVGSNGSIRCGYKQPAGHAEVHDPLRVGSDIFCRRILNACAGPIWLSVFVTRCAGSRGRPKFADDVLSDAVNFQQDASFKSRGLLQRRCFERLRKAGEPHLQDLVTAHARIDTPRDGFHFR